MIKLHYLNNSRAQRLLWLLEELNLEYELVTYERNKATMLAPPELRKIHPLGKSPVLEDDGRMIAESGAIVEYLLERHGDGALRPEVGSDEHLQYRYWLHYAEGSAMFPLVLSLVFSEMVRQSPWIAKPVMRGIESTMRKQMIDREVRNHAKHWENHLKSNTWFAGEQLTGADIQMSFPLEAFVSRSGMEGDYPHVCEYVARIHERDAYKRALERGDDYLYA